MSSLSLQTAASRLNPPAWATQFSWDEPPPFEPRRILEQMPRLMSWRTGFINSLYPVRQEPNEPRLHSYIARTGDILHHPRINNWCGTGIGLTAEEAIGATLGEALERYALFVAQPPLVQARYRDVQDCAINPADFARLSEQEYARAASMGLRLQPQAEDTVYSWVWGYSLQRRQPVLVPATLVYWNNEQFAPTERFALPVSSGTTLSQSLLQATLQGLYEVVERDAFMISWLNQLGTPRLEPAALAAQSPLLKQILDSARNSHVEIRLNNLTTDTGIPVVLCTCLNAGTRTPGLVVGASCNIDPEKAAAKAILEAFHCRVFFTDWFRQSAGIGQEGRLEPNNIASRDQHVILYTQPEMVGALDFLKAGPVQELQAVGANNSIPNSTAGKLTECVNRLAQCGMEAVVVDITVPEVAELGYRVVKVLIPQAQPLSFGPLRHVSGPRLYELPVKLGYRSSPLSESQLNPLPHPFP